MYDLGWEASFNTPSNYFGNLTGSISRSNTAHVKDSILEDLIAQGITETDLEKREALYIKIQLRINEIAVFRYLSTPTGRSVYNFRCQNTTRNPMGELYWYPWTFVA